MTGHRDGPVLFPSNRTSRPGGSSGLLFRPGRSLLLFGILLIGATLIRAGGPEPPAGPPDPVSRTEDSVDAPVKGLSGAADSLEAASRRFLEVLSRGHRDEILAQAVNREEFEALVYPTLPAARPGSNWSVDFLWEMSLLHSLGGLERTLAHAGNRYHLVTVYAAEGVREYSGFRLHRDIRLRVRDEEDREQEVKLFSSIIEMNGRFKIYSFRH